MTMFQVLVSPAAAFERLRGKGGWVVALVAVTLATAAVAHFQWPLIEREMMAQFERSGGIPEGELSIVVNIAKYTALVTSLVMPAFLMFFIGLLLYLMNLIVRGEGTYMQMSKVALYGMIPGLLGGLLTAALATGLGAERLTDVTLTAGAFFAEKSGFLFTLASAVLNPFALWGLAVTVVGAAVMSRRPVRSVAPWIVGAWLLVSLGSSLSALLPTAPGPM
ncbi:YIP1 family protein [Paenibacillus sp.]|uniref:YIP1 family protein n=1 Tax=Paenibacillus sp. TaxID=58172 RepID=UPI002D655A72|nr:YIP1 family protein [Paenibacillus sp.]HZG58616.1 YIP1 family protein [Paenibacillus sp.]